LGWFAGLIIADSFSAFHRFTLQNGEEAYIDVRLAVIFAASSGERDILLKSARDLGARPLAECRDGRLDAGGG
jgi:hypothetical protein